jgi:hypothetical protein
VRVVGICIVLCNSKKKKIDEIFAKTPENN